MPQKYEIQTRLERIEKKIDQSKLTSIRQWMASFGFGIMIASVSVLKQDILLTIIMLIGGLIITGLSVYIKKA
jgi:hypothetical protein